MTDKEHSFKPKDLHPLAGLAIPTLLKVMDKKVDEKLKLFYLFEATQRHIIPLRAGTAFCCGASFTSLINNLCLAEAVVFTVLVLLTVALHITADIIVGLKWRMHDEAKAFHEASAKIFEDFYGINPDDYNEQQRDRQP